MKVCCSCKLEKSLDNYSKSKVSKDGLATQCKECAKEYAKKWREKTKHDGRVTENKHCSTCNRIQPASEFFKDKSRQDGLSSQCRICIRQYREDNRDKILKAQKEQNRKRAEKEKPPIEGRICSQCKEYKLISKYWKSKHSSDGLYSCCKDCKRKLDSTENRIAVKRKNRQQWVNDNREFVRQYYNIWDKNKRDTDIHYKLRRNVMHAIVASVRNYNYCNGKLERLQKAIFDHLPYTADDLRKHIESLWEPWMSWDNHGVANKEYKTWQIDHIFPQSKLPFDSFEHENFKKLWALENLRPLETIANIKKSNKTIYC